MNSLPSGTVTFLMTDVEQSTRLTEQLPEPMRAALARHDALAQEAAVAHGGTLVKQRGEGDSLFMVFARATDAMQAAITFHNALLIEPWDLPAGLRIRMALHTGEADLRDGDYYGAAPNRCARIRATAHGGQILLSQTTSDLVRGLLPPGASLRDLGAHGLKDLRHPERLCQLLCPGWRDDFPPLHSLEIYRHNLPRQLTSFIGREVEMAKIKELLAKTCLLTLVGSGGSGKTRLALQVGADVVDAYADGVWLVELAPFSDPDLIAREIVKTLSCREEPGRHALDTLCDHLKPKSLLLILDNCEHLLEEAAQAANTLLKACPNLRILATSRTRLNVPGETAWRVPSLLVPDTDARPDVDAAMRHASLRLFAERAASARPQFAVTTANLPAVTQICRRLDGIPLAIELAAARVNSLSVQQVAQRLDKRFSLIVGGSSAVLERHQTLRALIDWSHDLLTARERVLLRRLAVFAGGWTLEGAEAVCAWGEIDADDVLELLSRLVETSLVLAEEQDDAQRYRLLETVRQYGQEQLQMAEEDVSARENHLRYFLDLAEEAEPRLTGMGQSVWLQTLEAEHDNLRAALAWAVGAETRMRLATALWRFWYARGHFAEGYAWLDNGLAQSASISPQLCARALHGKGFLAMSRGDYDTASEALTQCLQARRDLHDKTAIAESLNSLGMLAQRREDYEQAGQYYAQSLELFRASSDAWGTATTLNNLGSLARMNGEQTRAQTCYEQSLRLYRDLGDSTHIAALTSNLGDIAFTLNDFPTARVLFEDALQTFRQMGNKLYIASSLYNLAETVARLEGHISARPLLLESLQLQMELEDRSLLALTVTGLATAAFNMQDYGLAKVLLHITAQLCYATGQALDADSQQEYNMLTANLRAAMEETPSEDAGEDTAASEPHGTSQGQTVQNVLTDLKSALRL